MISACSAMEPPHVERRMNRGKGRKKFLKTTARRWFALLGSCPIAVDNRSRQGLIGDNSVPAWWWLADEWPASGRWFAG